MPSTINSTSTGVGGLISTAATDNALEIQTGDTTAIAIDSSQNVAINSVGALTIPVGTTAQRPGTPSTGAMRYNTSTGTIEFYNGSAWTEVGAATAELYASNGVVSHANSVSENYTVPTNANVITVTPWTVDSGVTFTLPSGSRQVLL